MPATIIIRITDEDTAKSCLAGGAKDLAGFLSDGCIPCSKVTLIYRTPEDEAKAVAGELGYKEQRNQWTSDSDTTL